MSYLKYKTKVEPLSPVAIKLGQTEVYAPGHDTWGVVACDVCGERFAIGPNRMYGSRRTDVDCAKDLEEILAEDHNRSRPHPNSFVLPD